MTVQNNVKYIPMNEFLNAPNLATVSYESSSMLTEIREYAFSQCLKLTSVDIPPSVDTIGNYAFALCSLLGPNMTMPSSIASVGESLFKDCISLQYVHWSKDCPITSLSGYFTEGSGLKEIEIWPALRSVAIAAFTGSYVEEFVPLGQLVHFKIIDGVLYSADQTKLVKVPNARNRSIEIPAYVQTIAGGAFRYSKCSEVTIAPASNLTLIETYALKFLAATGTFTIPEDCALERITQLSFSGVMFSTIVLSSHIKYLTGDPFGETSTITEIVVHENNPYFVVHDRIVYDIDINTAVAYPPGYSADDVVVRESVEVVEMSAFSFSIGKKLTFYSNIRQIKASAFAYSRFLTVWIPLDAPLETIPAYAFSSSRITSISFPHTVSSISGDAFTNSKVQYFEVSDESTTLATRDGIVYDIGLSKVLVVPPQIRGHVTLPATVSTIQKHSFASSTIESVGFESGSVLSTIQSGAFSGCSMLKVVAINKDCPLTKLEAGAFANSAIEELSLPNGLDVITTGLFEGCNYLTTIWMPLYVTTIEAQAFKNCPRLSNIVFPDGCAIRAIGPEAFAATPSLKAARIPAGVTKIANNAFSEQVERVTVLGSTSSAVMASIESVPTLKEIVVRCGKPYSLPSELVGRVTLSHWCFTKHNRLYLHIFKVFSLTILLS